MTVTEELVEWAWRLEAGDLPPEVAAAAGRHLLDGLGTAVAAARTGAAGPAVTVALGLGGAPESTVLGTGSRVSAPAAALANGTLVHALDFDDTHARGLVHATAVVLPAAFAVGQQVGASGADVLAAAVAGYESVTRLAAAAPHAFHARGLHATAVCGVFSAALVAARLMRLPQAQAVDALGIAGSSAGGLLEFLSTGASTKQLHPGLASSAGIVAARLAAAGASGPASAVDGRYGLYAALAAPGDVDAGRVTAGLGTDWEVTRIAVKPYPDCQLLHAALDAAREVRGRLDGAEPAEPAEVVEVVEVVATLPPESVPILCEPDGTKRRPRTPYEAKFSLPWSLAAMLLDGEVTTQTYAEDRLARPEVLALAARVRHEVVAHDGPAAAAPSCVTVRLADGRSLVAGATPGTATEEVVVAKFLAQCGGEPAVARRLADAVLHLADTPSLDGLLERTSEVAA